MPPPAAKSAWREWPPLAISSGVRSARVHRGGGCVEAVLVGNPEEEANRERTTEFIKLLTSHQPQIYAYIATMLFGDAGAADVLQDTNLHLWAQAEQYDVDRPFLPWAFGFARQRVMAYRKTCVRSRLVFCDDALDILNIRCVQASDTIDDRLTALQKCLAQLSTAQADLIRERYTARTSVKTIASRMNDSAHNISTRLHRIRKILAGCVERTLKIEGR
jgi:RNA polymerase sigma-70 factor, ECF subfamily